MARCMYACTPRRSGKSIVGVVVDDVDVEVTWWGLDQECTRLNVSKTYANRCDAVQRDNERRMYPRWY